jgi:transposase
MLSFDHNTRIWICLQPVDMRKGFDGLTGLVTEALRESIHAGALFAFTNKRRTRLKLLHFDGTGLWLMIKRLEQGTFFWPKPADASTGKLALTPAAFALLTDGIDMHQAKMRPWYQRD